MWPPYFKIRTLRAQKRILRLHNDEVRFFQELSKSTKNVLRKAFYQSEAAKFRVLSPKIMSKCDALWFISDYEREQHIKNVRQIARKPFLSRRALIAPP